MSDNQCNNHSNIAPSSVPAFTSSFQLNPAEFPNFTPFTTVSQSTSQPIEQSPNQSAKRSKKRALDDADDDEDDAPRYKRLRDESDAEDEEDDAVDQSVNHAVNEDGDDPLERDSFLSLLTHFASLHVPGDTMQACPVCEVMFPLSELASHAFECLKSLDDVERREQERLDEKLARSMMEHEIAQAGGLEAVSYSVRHLIQSEFEEQPNADESMENDDQSMDDKPERSATEQSDDQAVDQVRVRACAKGASCTRTDAQHFMLATHPLVECPICSMKMQIFQINEHINLCLDSDVPINQSNPESNATMNDESKTQLNPAFTELREHQPITRQESARPLPLRSDDDSDDEEDRIDPALIQATLNQSNGDASTNQPSIARSYSTSRPLTVEQASAMASLVLKRRDAMIGKSTPAANDPNLAQLLDTFKTLGLTHEGLSKLKEQTSSSQSSNPTSSSPEPTHQSNGDAKQ